MMNRSEITEDFKIKGQRVSTLAETKNRKGYILVHYHNQQIGKHILIAQAFPEICGEWFEGCEVHHIDRNRENNDPHNLIVLTKEEHHLLHTDKYERMKNKAPWNKGISGCFSEETRKKQSASKTGILNKGDSKPVSQYKEGVLIMTYPSAAEAQRQTGVNFRYISDCCRGRQKTAGGFVWKYGE